MINEITNKQRMPDEQKTTNKGLERKVWSYQSAI